LERKARENMLGESRWSMVVVRVKVLLGGKCTWKVSWWSVVDGGVGEMGVDDVCVVEVVIKVAPCASLLLVVQVEKRWDC